jgi:hypothetical protein
MRNLLIAAVIGPIASGCIIYADRYHHSDGGCDGCEPTADPPPATGTDPDPEPALTDSVALTVNEALPGEELLSTLVPTESGLDLTTVTALEFERDVEVLDSIQRPDEIVLLLSVADDAKAGPVEVYFTTVTGAGWILAEPFQILGQPASTPGTDTGAADTGAP